jgi:hypothetical protein
MRMTRAAAVAVPTAAVLAAGLPLAAHAASAGNAPRAGSTPAVAVYNCANEPQVRPSSFALSCDGSYELSKLSWTSWNLNEATATGLSYVNDCTPNCAQGTWSHTNVIVVLWRPEPVTGHKGDYGYSKITFLYPQTGKTQTQSPPGEF